MQNKRGEKKEVGAVKRGGNMEHLNMRKLNEGEGEGRRWNHTTLRVSTWKHWRLVVDEVVT